MPTTTTATATALLTAVRALASVCDGAHDSDGQGFNGTDAKFGRRIAECATVDDLRADADLAAEVYRTLGKYAAQLSRLGVPTPLPRPAVVIDSTSAAARESARRLERAVRNIPTATLDGAGNISVARSYDIRLSLKKAGAVWNPVAKTWDVPVAKAGNLKAVIKADNLAIRMTPEVEAVINTARASVPAAAKVAPRKISVQGEVATISFDRNDADFGRILEGVRALPMRRWNNDAKCWTAPLTPVLFAFAEAFNFALPKNVLESENERISAQAENVDLSRSLASDGDVAIKDNLYPFQIAGVEYAVKARRALIGDEMGLGKTRQAISALETADCFPAVIVCPASLKENWKKEFNALLPHRSVEVVSGRKAKDVTADVIVINYDVLAAWEPFLNNVVGLVFDESHYIKNPKANRTAAAHALAAKVPH